MKIAIIAAMDKELKLLLSLLEDRELFEKESYKAYKGQIGNHEVFISKCGIGKVNAALKTQNFIKEFQPDLIINSGVAGGTDSSLKIGTVLIADKIAYNDVWCGPGTTYGQADGFPLFFRPSEKCMKIIESHDIFDNGNISLGLITSGDKFISSMEEVKNIKKHFPDCLGCDMESAAIAQTCYKNNIPFLIFRILSDMPESGNNIEEYKDFWKVAPERTFMVLKHLIEKL